MLTLSVFPIYITPPLPACITYDCREGHGVIIGNTQCYSISFLFLFFFHQSSLYPIKIFAKYFYLLVFIMNKLKSSSVMPFAAVTSLVCVLFFSLLLLSLEAGARAQQNISGSFFNCPPLASSPALAPPSLFTD